MEKLENSIPEKRSVVNTFIANRVGSIPEALYSIKRYIRAKGEKFHKVPKREFVQVQKPLSELYKSDFPYLKYFDPDNRPDNAGKLFFAFSQRGNIIKLGESTILQKYEKTPERKDTVGECIKQMNLDDNDQIIQVDWSLRNDDFQGRIIVYSNPDIIQP